MRKTILQSVAKPRTDVHSPVVTRTSATSAILQDLENAAQQSKLQPQSNSSILQRKPIKLLFSSPPIRPISQWKENDSIGNRVRLARTLVEMAANHNKIFNSTDYSDDFPMDIDEESGGGLKF